MGVTPAAFKATIRDAAPAVEWSAPLQALWWAAKDDWERAHILVQNEASAEAAWVHAYLHRVEGDLPNARYWYAKAHRPESADPLPAEWDTIAAALLTVPE